MTSYTIETKQYTDISEVSAIRVGLSNLELFVKAEFDVRLYKTDGSFYKRFNFALEGDDYHNWGNSDDYVINKICEAYGFVIVPEETSNTAPETTTTEETSNTAPETTTTEETSNTAPETTTTE
jgi:hypothetical protein